MTHFIEVFVSHLYRWQELAGAVSGPFIAVLLSAVSYKIGRWTEKSQQEKESLRRIEVGVTYTLNSIATMRQKLLYFVASLRNLIKEIEAISNPKEFAMQTINFPALGTIYLDEELPRLLVKSYYLHNKLLWIHSGVADVNNILNGLKEDFIRVVRLNEKMIDLMKDAPNPPAQRASYIENLKLFADGIEKFAKDDLIKGVKTLMEVKVYNDKLRKGRGEGTRTRWKNEGSSSWLVRRFFNVGDLVRNLNNIDRIDKELDEEVNKEIAVMWERDQAREKTPPPKRD
jgi:hypothetical protein